MTDYCSCCIELEKVTRKNDLSEHEFIDNLEYYFDLRLILKDLYLNLNLKDWFVIWLLGLFVRKRNKRE